MIDCPFQLNADGLWQCTQCPYIYPIRSDKPPRKICPMAPSIVEAAKKLGIPENETMRYASILHEWQAEGCPIREQEEIDWIHQTLCMPCESYVRFARCKRGTCKNESHSVELKYMLPMATTCCARGKF